MPNKLTPASSRVPHVKTANSQNSDQHCFSNARSKLNINRGICSVRKNSPASGWWHPLLRNSWLLSLATEEQIDNVLLRNTALFRLLQLKLLAKAFRVRGIEIRHKSASKSENRWLIVALNGCKIGRTVVGPSARRWRRLRTLTLK